MSFKTRLRLSIVGLLVSLVAILSLVYLRHLLEIELRFALEQARILAEQVQSALIDEGGRLDRLPPILARQLAGSPTIAEIAVTDGDGRLLADSAGLAGGAAWQPRPALQDLAEQGLASQLRSIYSPGRDYELSLSLAAGGRPALIIRVVVSSTLLRRQIDPPIRRLALLAAAGLGASLLMAVVFSRVAFRPLDRLGEAIDRMTRGEFAAPEVLPGPARDEYSAISSKLSLLGQQFSSLRGNMQQLLHRLEDAVLLFDHDDRLLIASASAETFLGLGRWQIMGQKLDNIFPAGTELGALVSSAARLRQPLADRLVELPGAQGRAPRLLLSVELIDDFASRRRLGLLVTFRDAETRRQIQTQVDVSSRLAAISRLTSGVAHEIKNPLNSISVHLTLLRTRLAKALVAPAPELEIIAAEMARLDRVVKTFLDFTRPVDLRLTEAPLGPLVEEISALAGPDALQQQVRLLVSNQYPEALVQVDRDLFKQAVLNLVLNGIQAMPSGGELTLAMARSGSEVELGVADQGVGIAPADQEKIFRLYHTTKPGGSGIGLAMTFRVVQLHNGTIEFSSELGRGTTFRVRLPVVNTPVGSKP